MIRRSSLVTGLACLLIALTISVGSNPARFGQHGNRPTTEVRIEKAFAGIVFFSGQVNSVGPLGFLLDTGGAGCLIDTAVATRLALKTERAQATTSGNNELEVGLIQSAKVQIGEIQFQGRLIASPLSHLEPIFGRPLEGILGGDFLRRYVVELDFETNVMRLYEPTGFRYEGRALAIPLTLIQDLPFVDLDISLPNGKSIKGSFLIDSGGNMVVHVFKPIAERDNLANGLETLAETGHGIGGTTRRVAVRGSALALGSFQFARPVVVFTGDTAVLRANPASSGLIGMEVLRRFKVTFDYSRSRIYLEPNRAFAEPFVYDASGLGLRAARPAFSPPYVASVITSSPAEQAGIQPDDVLLEIGGRSTSGVNLEVIRETLQQPGKQHSLTLSRGQKTIKTTLRTRELLN